MLKKLKKAGKSISVKDSAYIQNISDKGIWLLVNKHEFFMPFTDFPWFLKGTIEEIYNLQFLHGKHLQWPELDIDIELDSLTYPEAYPLRYS